MSHRAAAWLAWSMWALCVALFASAASLDFFNPSLPTRGGPIFGSYIWIALLAYPTVGAIVASRRPKNLVGWILCGIGLMFGVEAFAEAYAYYALAAGSDSLPGGVYMAWFSEELLLLPVLFLGSALLVLLFPNGRLLSRSWRAVVWLAVGGSAMTALWLATWPGRISSYPPYRISNPFGIEGNLRYILEVLGRLGAATLLVCCVLAVISVFVRLQSAEGEERQQIKWFAYAAAVLLSTFFLGLPLAAVIGAIGGTWAGLIPIVIGVSTIPVAFGIAILKYRLYDIDLLINRTLVYGVLTVMLTFWSTSVVSPRPRRSSAPSPAKSNSPNWP